MSATAAPEAAPTATTPAAAATAEPVDAARTTTLAPRGLTAFLVIAFAFSWGAWWAGSTFLPGGNPMPTVIAGSFGPAVAAVIVTLATDGISGVGALFRRYSPRRRGWFRPLAAIVLVLAAIAGSAAVPVYLQGAVPDIAALSAAAALAPVNFLVIALAGGGNEELGWRGFALPRLQGALPPVAANAVLGAIWAVWHAPLFTIAGTVQSDVSFPAYALLCVALTVILGYVFNASRGGVLLAVAAHAAVNVVTGLKGTAVGDPAGIGEVALVGLAALILVVLTRGRLGVATAGRRPRR
ncbi:CPBP family intramembrane metalloprotease [Streptomonospora sp. S1-112]|uniref:CPBP family intramembrane metalloprotease n=1 Tax=Streptomonospora mangrovi TaxID=2883123 RepID=A0A9X3NJW4_9ACTN|nr:type II CAAX endopeptidase family protein [Streptomonospora mangrovi]MDA0565102.1 CPBP family intramembrane metalloprotease [Streptomonospora mangrovi]